MTVSDHMPRWYLNNDSYPELRGVQGQWTRSRTWWRAIARGARHADFWVFVATQVSVLIGFLLADIAIVRGLGLGRMAPAADTGLGLLRATGEGRVVHLVLGALALVLVSYLQVSLGGDMMRRHLRAVSEVARFACPACGQSLYGHLEAAARSVRCPECATQVDRRTFEPPFPIPRELRAFPPWGRPRAPF